MIECGLQLPTRATHKGELFQDPDVRPLIDPPAGFVYLLLINQHLPGQDEGPRLVPAFRQPPLHQYLINSVSFHIPLMMRNKESEDRSQKSGERRFKLRMIVSTIRTYDGLVF